MGNSDQIAPGIAAVSLSTSPLFLRSTGAPQGLLESLRRATFSEATR
jgi:hypothetical protein